mmetsp:Transcript_61520/g.158730  ORF Transcript_61520/g.158730 Transcript_61520/m.158730 type:complete len:230 (-) Transcript_61520:126-815(-)
MDGTVFRPSEVHGEEAGKDRRLLRDEGNLRGGAPHVQGSQCLPRAWTDNRVQRIHGKPRECPFFLATEDTRLLLPPVAKGAAAALEHSVHCPHEGITVFFPQLPHAGRSTKIQRHVRERNGLAMLMLADNPGRLIEERVEVSVQALVVVHKRRDAGVHFHVPERRWQCDRARDNQGQILRLQLALRIVVQVRTGARAAGIKDDKEVGDLLTKRWTQRTPLMHRRHRREG